MKKSIVCIAMLITFLSVQIHAKTIGFSCMHNTEAPHESAVLTTILETALFDRCFDMGFIVTGTAHNNSGDQDFKNEQRLKELFESDLHYLVAIYCEYEPVADTNIQNTQWKQLSWKLIDLNGDTVIRTETIDPEKIKEKDMITKARFIGNKIAKAILREVLIQH